jgi:hypothetical protein
LYIQAAAKEATRMKTNFWKWVTILLLVGLIWQQYSRHSVAAQYGTRITKFSGVELTNGPISVSGEIKGFSCIADVRGDLDKGDGNISSDTECYVLTR